MKIQDAAGQVGVVLRQSCSNLGLHDLFCPLRAVDRDELGLRQGSHRSLLLFSSLTDLGILGSEDKRLRGDYILGLSRHPSSRIDNAK